VLSLPQLPPTPPQPSKGKRVGIYSFESSSFPVRPSKTVRYSGPFTILPYVGLFLSHVLQSAWASPIRCPSPSTVPSPVLQQISAHPSPSKSKTRKLVVAAPERTFGPKSIRHNLVPSILYASK